MKSQNPEQERGQASTSFFCLTILPTGKRHGANSLELVGPGLIRWNSLGRWCPHHSPPHTRKTKETVSSNIRYLGEGGLVEVVGTRWVSRDGPTSSNEFPRDTRGAKRGANAPGMWTSREWR